MKINSIQNIINNVPQIKKFNRQLIYKPYSDTFVRTTSFKGTGKDSSFIAFEKWANETGFLDNASEIIDKTGRVLGSGFEGTVFEIPGNDTWVIKTIKRSEFFQQNTEKPQIFEVKDKLPDLNIGQMIAYVYLPVGENLSRMFYILKRQNGQAYGINNLPARALTQRSIDKHLNSLKTMSELPFETYRQMIRDIMKINDAGYILDYYNPNNILIDDENKRINFVDAEPNNKEPVNYQFSDMLCSLLDGSFGSQFLKSCDDETKIAEAKKYSLIIKEKYQKAIEEEVKLK